MKTSFRFACLPALLCWASLFSQQVLGDGICVPVEPPPIEVIVPTGPDQPAPIVTVKVLAPACAEPGKNLEYRITVKNCSPAAAHGVFIYNSIGPHARFVQASPQPHKIEPELQWNLGTLAGNGCQDIILILAPTSAEDITNITRVQFEHGICVTTRSAGAVAPPKPPEKTKTTEPPLSGKGKLKIGVKGPPEQKIGEPASYRITVTNVGTDPAKEVLIDALLDDQLTFVSAKNEEKFQKRTLELKGKIVWPIGDLEVNDSRTVELTVKAKAVGKWCFKTQAYADSGDVKTEGVNTCTMFGASALSVRLYDHPDPIPVGGTVNYIIYVKNEGHLTVTNLQLQAIIPPGMDLMAVKSQIEHKEEGNKISFGPLSKLVKEAQVDIEVTLKAKTPGEKRFRIQLSADQLQAGGPVYEEENTTVFDDKVTR